MSRHVSLVARALLFGVILNLPYLLEYHRSAGYSLNNLSDADEAVYLELPSMFVEGKGIDTIYYEHDTGDSLRNIIFTNPAFVCNFFIGIIGKGLQLNPVELGLLLDVFCSFLSYYCLSLLLFRVTRRHLISEVGTIVVLCFPWAFAITNLIHFDLPLTLRIGSPSFVSHSTLPVLRSVNTQMSYPFFALSLLFAARSVMGQKRRNIWAAFSGVFSGLSLYIYFFAWAASIVIVGNLIIISSVTNRLKPLRKRMVEAAHQMISFVITNILVAAPLFVAFVKFRVALDLQGFTGSELYNHWFFSVEEFLLLLVIVVISPYLVRHKPDTRILSCFIKSAVLADFILMNLQPFFHTFLTPIHFLVFYTQPLIGGLIVTLLLCFLEGTYRRKLIRFALSSVIVLFATYQSVMKSFSLDEDKEFSAFARFFAEDTPPDSVIAMLPFARPFKNDTPYWFIRYQPNALRILANRYLLFQAWVYSVSLTHEEIIKRELAMGWLYSGSIQLLQPCIDQPLDNSSDRYFQQWIAMQFFRKNLCKTAREILPVYSACDALKDFKSDYVVWEDDFIFDRPSWYREFMSFVWKSPEGRFVVYKFARQEAIAHFCSSSYSQYGG